MMVLGIITFSVGTATSVIGSAVAAGVLISLFQ